MHIICIYKVKVARHTYVYKQSKNDTLLEQVKSAYSDNTKANLRETLFKQQMYVDFFPNMLVFLCCKKQKDIKIF